MKRRFCMAVDGEEVSVFYISRRSSFKRDLFVKKGVLLRIFEDGIDGADEVGFGTPVAPEGIAEIHVTGSPHVSKEIGPAKAVDGLLGIADEKKRGLSVSKDGVKYCVLYGVRILELVDKGCAKAASYFADEVLAAGSLQCLFKVEKKIIVKLDISRLFSFPQFLPQITEYVRFEEKEMPLNLGLKLATPRHEFLAVIEERMFGG
jgi:hypothetical protein